jgi:site-specific recombinase XerD
MVPQLILPSNPHFVKVAERFLDVISTTLEPKTVIGYRTSIFAFSRFLDTHYPQVTRFSQLKRSPHIEKWLSHLTNCAYRNETKRTHILQTRRFLTDMYAWGWNDAPKPGLFEQKDIPPVNKHLPRPISPETDQILKKVLRPNNNLFAQGLLLLRLTGMRVGEMKDLELDCLKKLGNNQYLLHVPIGKLHTERIIPVCPEAANIIRRVKKLRGIYPPIPHPRTKKLTQFLFLKENGRRPTYSGFRMYLLRLSRKYKFKEHVTVHMLRHTFATELLRCGMSLPGLMKILGHRKITMTLRYTAVTQLDLQKSYYNAIEKVNSTDLIPQPSQFLTKNNVQVNECSYVFAGIENLIVKIENIRRDLAIKKNKTKIQRITERLRRAQQDLKIILKK